MCVGKCEEDEGREEMIFSDEEVSGRDEENKAVFEVVLLLCFADEEEVVTVREGVISR